MHVDYFSPLLLAELSADETGRAIGIAITGMLIVFLALSMISGFLTVLPRVLDRVNQTWPESTEHHPAPARSGDNLLSEDDAVLAAIGYVLHLEAQNQR